MSRQHVYFIFVLVLVGAVLLTSIYILEFREPSTDPTILTYYTEQFPPYNYEENGTLKGLAVDLLGEITSKMGKTVTSDHVHLVPWTEGYQAALDSNNTVLFSTVRLTVREQSFNWAGPISTDNHVLFARWDQGITINSSADLNSLNYSIGVISDTAAIPQLLNAGVDENQLVYETNASRLIEKLSSGEIDL
jgi:polar amino acid transport system substrate-binding protein